MKENKLKQVNENLAKYNALQKDDFSDRHKYYLLILGSYLPVRNV